MYTKKKLITTIFLFVKQFFVKTASPTKANQKKKEKKLIRSLFAGAFLLKIVFLVLFVSRSTFFDLVFFFFFASVEERKKLLES